MGKRLGSMPDEVFSRYIELRAGNRLNQSQIGKLLISEFPGVFRENSRPVSAVKLVQARAVEQDVELPVGQSGGQLVPAPDSRWAEKTPELVVPFDPKVLIMSDVHAGAHSVPAVERALEVIRDKRISLVVFNGDLLDNAYKGHHGLRTKWAQPHQEGLEAAQGIVQAVADCESVTSMVFLCGNHDDKAFRDTDREIEFDGHLKLGVLEHVTIRATTKVCITNRYYAIMEPQAPKAWPWTGPENFASIFTHQSEYGRGQLGVAKRLVDVDIYNTYCGHQHHLAVGKHPNGLLYLVDCGTFQDADLPAYKNARQSTHPKWSVGFVTILHGVPEIWSMDYSQAWWDSKLT